MEKLRRVFRLSIAIAVVSVGVFSSLSTNDHTARAASPIIWAQLGLDLDGEASDDQSGTAVAMSANGTRIAIGARYNDGNGSNAGHVRVYDWNGSTWTQVGIDINGEAASDQFGISIAMSTDGSRIAIGAPENDGNGSNAGHVRVYDWNGSAWTQVGDDIDGEAAGDWSGTAVAMSSNGSRIAIGAFGNQSYRGHVRVYDWNGSTWRQVGGDIDGEAEGDDSGSAVAMSSDGTRIAIGAPFHDDDTGQVRVYDWNGSAWTQVGGDIDGEAAGDRSGTAVAMSANGTRITIGARYNDGNGSNAGHVRVYDLNGSTWTQVGDDIDGEAAGDQFGISIAMSTDGSRIAIGAPENDGTGSNAGHVRVYDWNGSAWTQVGDDIDGEANGDQSGYAVAISSDKSRIAIGAPRNDGSSLNDSGHVRVFAAATLPSAPTITSITPGDGSLSVAFTAGSDGGSPIINYKYSTDGTTFTVLSPASTTSPFTIAGLTNGTAYSVTIKAVTNAGDSIASNAVSGTPTADEAQESEPPTTTESPTTTTIATATTTPVTTSAPTTSAVTLSENTTKVQKQDKLPATGSNSSLPLVLAAFFATAGILITVRRRLVG
jgi:LPXTG-motif cell wall-anchored protein